MYYVQHNCKHTIHSRIDRTQLRGLSAGREAKPCKHALLLHKLVWGKQKNFFTQTKLIRTPQDQTAAMRDVSAPRRSCRIVGVERFVQQATFERIVFDRANVAQA